MHSKRIAAALAVLALAGCGSATEARADACKQALEEHLGAPDLLGFTVSENTQGVVTGHIDTKNGLGEPSRIEVTCTVNGDKVSVKTDPEF